MKNRKETNLINFFLRRKDLTRSQQARFAELVSRDMGGLNPTKITEQKEKEAEERVTIHSPHKTFEFLSLFSRSDHFKWYTHKWDMTEPFNVDEEIEKQRIYKSELTNMVYCEGPAVNEKTYNQVWNFINFNNDKEYPWQNTEFENIKYGWRSIVELSKDDPEIPVENIELDDGRQFKDYIRMFKAAIEFRVDLKDDYRFRELIMKRFKSELPKDFNVTYSLEFQKIGKDLNTYCDVVGILTAINQLCSWLIKHKSRSSNVNIDLVAADEYYILEITHKDSYFNNKEKLKNPSGDFENIRRRLFSVCDFSMEGDYIEDGVNKGSLIIGGLDESTEMRGKALTPCIVNALENEIGGVKYKLKIYKK